MKPLLAYDPRKNRYIKCGTVVGDTLFRDVKPEHFMRIVQGYGIQEIAFQEALQKGIKIIVLKETHTDQRWEATTKEWAEYSKLMDFGHGKQRFLSLKFMRTHKVKTLDEIREEREKVQ